jgi:hypothetical protein
VTTPDLQFVLLELANGALVRLTASFYIGQQSKGYAGMAFHGDLGSLWLDHFSWATAGVEIAKLGDREPHVPVEPVRAPERSMDWARVLVDLAEAIRDDRPHRATGDQAAHIVDILEGARRSMAADGAPIDITTSFPVPAPMPWAMTEDERRAVS